MLVSACSILFLLTVHFIEFYTGQNSSLIHSPCLISKPFQISAVACSISHSKCAPVLGSMDKSCGLQPLFVRKHVVSASLFPYNPNHANRWQPHIWSVPYQKHWSIRIKISQWFDSSTIDNRSGDVRQAGVCGEENNTTPLKTTALEASETQTPHDGLTTERLNCLYSMGKG